MKVGLGQINTTVGDFFGNEEKILGAYAKGVRAGVDLVVCPELATSGYPPRDLLTRRDFLRASQDLLQRLAAATSSVGLVVGFVGKNEERPGREATNAVALLQEGKVVAVRNKTLLPSYDVFDEDRYFEPARENAPVDFKGQRLGLTICEDAWNDESYWSERRYPGSPVSDLVKAGAEVIINVSASPWHLGKNRTRHQMLRALCQKTETPFVYCNLIGGNDELVFDGGSLVLNERGELIARALLFEEDFVTVNLQEQGEAAWDRTLDESKIYQALVLGTRDYLHKCGFRSAVLGLSGGIDSALTACIAVDALGAENVRGVSLPSQYSSPGSLDDAASLAAALGIQYDVVPIRSAFESMKTGLDPLFEGRAEDTTEENIQARLRGVFLMALSNKFGSLLLTTGNKSEMAVGYCTLYGDMCGGLAVINDVPKVMVYRLSQWLNRERGREIIPESTLTKPPSAELRPDQTDQDSLPPYEILDAILEGFVVEGRSVPEIVAQGYDPEVVERVVRLIANSEYKRRQAAPGLKVTSKAFGVGRRIPIAHRFRQA